MKVSCVESGPLREGSEQMNTQTTAWKVLDRATIVIRGEALTGVLISVGRRWGHLRVGTGSVASDRTIAVRLTDLITA